MIKSTLSDQMRPASQRGARLVGGHLSAAGGVDKAIERASAIGANCVQVFSASPRSWRRGELADLNVKKIWQAQEEWRIAPIITHAMYLINLASPKSEQLENSRQVIAYDLEFDARLAGGGVVVHLGSHLGAGWEAVRDQVATQISELLGSAPAEATFLIENSAGQKGKLSSDLSEIRWLLDQVNRPNLGWCLDTCHAHAAGYTLGAQASAEATLPTLLEVIEELRLFESLRVIHVNDSRDPFASGRDRHANIGEGEIPGGDLEYFLNLPQLLTRPIITEVPGIKGEGPDRENLDRIKKLLK